jgi:hypothetical protein
MRFLHHVISIDADRVESTSVDMILARTRGKVAARHVSGMIQDSSHVSSGAGGDDRPRAKHWL